MEATKKAKLAEAEVHEKAALEARAAIDAINISEEDAVADVKAAIAAQAKAATEASNSRRAPITPQTLGLPAPPPPPPAANANGPLPPNWQEASGPTGVYYYCLLYTSPSPRDRQKSRMPSSA